jgi:hypothetical protein
MKFKNLYYTIWSDIIVRYRIKNPNIDDKNIKLKLLILVSSINAMNIWIVVIWLKILKIYNSNALTLNLLSIGRMNSALAFFFQFVSPFIIINYLFIFRKDRYLSIIKRYSTPKNNYGNVYIFSILILTLISLLYYGFITGQLLR